jgi:hypothetical protein
LIVPGQKEPIMDSDGQPILPPEIHFADRQVQGALRDIADRNNALVARIALTQLLPAAYVGALVEGHIVNPLLAAPAHLYEAALRLLRAAHYAGHGEVARALADEHAAEELIREAALAIMAVVPLGEGVGATAPPAERLSAAGIEYLSTRNLPATEKASALHQMWALQSHVEHLFVMDGKKIFVDGFVNTRGLDYVDKAANMVLVEVKMGSRIQGILAHADLAAQAFKQLQNYMALARRLGLRGVRYLITEGGEASATAAFRETLLNLFPEEMASGFLEVFSTPPPPPSFTGFYSFPPGF